MILSPAELRELTNARRSDAQARELDHLGIPYKERRDGSLVVMRIHCEHGQTQNKEQASPALRLP